MIKDYIVKMSNAGEITLSDGIMEQHSIHTGDNLRIKRVDDRVIITH